MPDTVSVPGGLGFTPPHHYQCIQCTVAWFLSVFPAANENALVGQLQDKSQIHPPSFFLLASARAVLF